MTETPPNSGTLPWYRSAWLWWTLRVVMTLWFLQVLLQVVLAAGFISGNTAWFSMHSLGGVLIVIPLFVAFPIAIVHAVLARGARWPIPVVTGLFLLTGVQATLGWTRSVGVHVVGGVLLFAFALLTCVELWRRRHTPRPRRQVGSAVPEVSETAPVDSSARPTPAASSPSSPSEADPTDPEDGDTR